uniref:uncharacterized protein LOC120341038 isoform X1 n=1 Tax=Styela clava TaxID=7725 RepID=UPI00193A603A|nr:uncharacterized protein LOC120341038 isoform X1 [Styela clava]
MQSILKNSLPSEGLGSLRKTRTSEVSAFVKNYNQAQTRALRKEVEIWHKDTRHILRSMNDRQHKLYSSLLELSKTKKLIKTQRQDEDKTKKLTNDLEWRKKDILARRLKKASLDQSDGKSLNIMKIRHFDYEEKLSKNRKSSPIETMVQMASGTFSPNTAPHLALTIGNVTAFENMMDNLTETEYLGKALEDTVKKDVVCENVNEHLETRESGYEISKKDLNDSDTNNTVIAMVENANLSPPLLSSRVSQHSDFIRGPNCLNMTKPHRLKPDPILPASGELKTLSKFAISRSKRRQRLKDIEFAQFDKLTIPENDEVSDFSPQKKHGFTTKQYLNTSKNDFFESVENEITEEHCSPNQLEIKSQVEFSIDSECFMNEKRRKSNKGRRKRRKYNSHSSKTPSNPSEEMNNRSSIQAMEGKQYQVTVYKKDIDGNLNEESELIDTTVDVAKYFHFASHRDRLTRQQLLKDARDKEIKQRKRVSEFLVKLSQDEEEGKRRMKLNAKNNEEARLALKKRLEAIKKGPPKYGIIDPDESIPGYVREYIRPPKNEKIRAKRERKRSSWCLPSIYTLNASLNGANSLSTSFNSGGNSRHSQQIKDFNLSSSHLVNINMEKYIIQAASQ